MTTTINNEHKKLNFSSEREQSQACLNSAEHEKNQGQKVLNVPISTDKGKTIRNVPHLRFPEFQGEWEKCKLGDYGKVVTGNTPPTKDSENYENGTYLWASPADLGTIKSITETKTMLSAQGFSKTRTLPKGSVLVTCIGSTIGKAGMATKEMSTNQQINSIVVNDNNDNEFVYYAIQSAFPRYLSSIAVQAVPIISKSAFELLPNNRPYLQEQKKIGKFLSMLDERIATQNKIIDKLQSLIKGIAQHCIRELVKGCGYVRLGDICKITTGKLDANAQVENGQYPFFTCAELPFNIDSYAFDTEALLISGNGANLGYINYYNGKFNAYQRTYVLDHFSVDIQYVKWALKVLLPKRIAIEKSSSNTPYIVLSTLANLKLPIPSKSKQSHISNLMLSFERKLSNQLALNDHYNKQKQYMLRQMFI